RATQEISAPPSAATYLAHAQAPWSPGSSGAAASLSGRATQRPIQPPAFAVAGLWPMVSGTDDQLRRQWTRPGQTLRAPANRQARDPPEVSLNTSPGPIAESCVARNIIVRVMHVWNWRYCATTGKQRQRR